MTSSASKPAEDPGALALFRNRDFAFYWIARFTTSIAVQMQIVAISWQVWELTKDPLDLGFIGLAEFVPAIALGLITGAAADRYDRRTILILCYGIEAVCSASFFWFSWHGLTQAWPIFVILVVLGVARAFTSPASSALMPNLVPREQFGRAVALNSMSWQVATISGPALGGVVLLLGTDVVYASTFVGILLSSMMMWRVTPRPASGGREPVSWATLLAGLHFIRSRPVIFGAISLDLFAVLFGGAVALLPIYATDILAVGPQGLGALRAAPGVGALLIAIYLAHRPITHRLGYIMFACVGLWGLSIIIFGISTWFWLSLAMMAVSGAVDMVSVYVRQNVIQLGTPDQMRGRVSAVNSIFIGASNELGQFRAGVMGVFFGPIGTVLIGGVATVIVTGLWMKFFPALRDINRPEDSITA
jgi:MFS family permease